MKKIIIFGIAFILLASIVFGANPVIDEWLINPCINQAWKNGTDVEIRITVSDSDGDDISAKAIIYFGDSNEISTGWYAPNVSSGEEIIFDTTNFKGRTNKTITDGTIKLYGRSTGVGDLLDTIEIPFDVSTIGVEYDDCTSSALPSEDVNVTTGDDAITTAIDSLSDESADTFFSGLTRATLWVLLMVIVSLGIWITCGEKNANGITLGIIALVNFLLVMIGVYMNFISWIIVIIILIAGAVYAGIKIKSNYFN